MTPRRFASVLLLALAVLSVGEITIDASAHRVSSRQHWQARGYHGSLRASARRDPALAADDRLSPDRCAFGVIPPDDGVRLPLLIPVAIFVPPRV